MIGKSFAAALFFLGVSGAKAISLRFPTMKFTPQAYLLAASLGSAESCSRVFQNVYDTMVSGRSMDWGFSWNDALFINPRGQEMDGGAGDMSITWTSKYGSVTESIIPFFKDGTEFAESAGMGSEACKALDFVKDGSMDGINEMGLAAHALELGEKDGTKYDEPSATEAVNISYMRWIRYILDNFATVEEVVENLPKVKTIRHGLCDVGDGNEHVLGGHMALEDATGDSAVIEHVGGSWQIYHDKNNALVMTNEPTFTEQKAGLELYEPWGGNITLPDNLPGSVGSHDRFIRLEYFLQYTPEPETYQEAIANVRSLISNTNVPFGAPYKGGVYPTFWTSFTDVTNKIYFFDWLTTPNVLWVELEDIDFETLKEPLTIQPQDLDLIGNILCDFKTVDGEDPNLKGCYSEAAVPAPVPAPVPAEDKVTPEDDAEGQGSSGNGRMLGAAAAGVVGAILGKLV